MREVVIISGKGGTGKTTVVASFAAFARDHVLADADVEAPNLHLLLAPRLLEERRFGGSRLARIDPALCVECGRCESMCQFAAITGQFVNPRRCEGCGTCALVCPVGAVSMVERTTGRLCISDTAYGPLVHARLYAGAEASGRLVTEVRRLARELAEVRGASLILTDGSPGIGCPVIASLTGADSALVVTEPTLSGLHDLGRVGQVIAHFRVPAAVIVNKWDVNREITVAIEQASREAGLQTLARIPFDEEVMSANAEGIPLPRWRDCPAARAVREAWEALLRSM